MQHPPHDQKAECRQFIRYIEDEVSLKSAQARQAVERGDDLSELLALYGAARNAWNAKADWLGTNGPAYLNSGGFAPKPERFPEPISEDAQRFFLLLSGGDEEEGKVFPRAQSDLDRIHNNCRNEFESSDIAGLFHVRHMPAYWEEFILLK